MIIYPEINPIALQLGPIAIRWYGLTYLFGFVLGYFYLINSAKNTPRLWNRELIFDLLFYIAIGVILGGKVGYVVFYQPELLVTNPFELFKFWDSGRSFHGGMLGVIAALYMFAKNKHKKLLDVADFIIPAVPIGLGLGRIGNFINGELWGRVTDVPWGMVVPFAGDMPRHPSQLYQFLLEGVVLFIILHLYAKTKPKSGKVSAMFLILYSVFRFIVEFYREPDWFLGFVFGGHLTMGQVLSIPTLILGVWVFYRKNRI